FLVWAVLAGAVLGGSSVVGAVITAVIGPREYDYSKMWATAATPVAAVPRADLANARPTEFGPLRPAAPGDAAPFQGVLDAVGSAAPFGQAPWAVQQQFDFARMAEELARIGAYKGVGKEPTGKSLADDAQTLQNAVAGLTGRGEGPLAWERAAVLRVVRSAAGDEAQVLARHVVKVGGAERVEYRRWWLKNSTGDSGG